MYDCPSASEVTLKDIGQNNQYQYPYNQYHVREDNNSNV